MTEAAALITVFTTMFIIIDPPGLAPVFIALTQGMTPAQRRAIQSRLRAFGYYNGRLDGAFGPGTYRAVVAYARDSGGERQLQTQAGAFGIYDSLIY